MATLLSLVVLTNASSAPPHTQTCWDSRTRAAIGRQRCHDGPSGLHHLAKLHNVRVDDMERRDVHGAVAQVLPPPSGELRREPTQGGVVFVERWPCVEPETDHLDLDQVRFASSSALRGSVPSLKSLRCRGFGENRRGMSAPCALWAKPLRCLAQEGPSQD